MNELESLGTEDIAPILGNLQLTLLQQEKTIRVLKARIQELEQPVIVTENGAREKAKVG